jgi:hypothetical protein
MGSDNDCKKKRISNIEQRISNAEGKTSSFEILCSIFDIPCGPMFMIHELPAAEGLAARLRGCISAYAGGSDSGFCNCLPLAAMGSDNECKKKRISNIEQRISNAEGKTSSFEILCSIFDIPCGPMFMIHELPAAEGKTSAFDIRCSIFDISCGCVASL